MWAPSEAAEAEGLVGTVDAYMELAEKVESSPLPLPLVELVLTVVLLRCKFVWSLVANVTGIDPSWE